MPRLNWGIMGLDNIAGEYAESLNKLGGAYAVAGNDPVEVEEFKRKYNVKIAYHSFEKMLDDKNVDAVYVSTLEFEHFENIMACLRHGKHVFCEKAILSKKNEICQAYELASSKNLFLGEAMTIFYMPIYKKIKQIIADDGIGKLKTIKVDFGSLKQEYENKNLFSKEKGGGAMLDIGTYALTFVIDFMSSLPVSDRSVMAWNPTGVDEMWSIVLKNAEQEIGTVNLTFKAKLPKRAVIAGDKAYILIYNYPRADKAEIVYPDGKTIPLNEGKSSDAVPYEILAAEDAIVNNHYEISRLDKSIAVVSLMEKLITNAQH